jgi:DNA-binding GntR family transcriptional regulator
VNASLAARIRHKILAGEYRPGAPLVQDTLASELGVGKAPVREALMHLRAEGLIDDHANRGFKVPVLSHHELFEAWAAGDEAAVGTRTRRHIEEARAELTRFVEHGTEAP